MLGFSHLEIIRKLILLITGILIGYTCLTFTPGDYSPYHLIIHFEPAERVVELRRRTVTKAIFRCVGIAIIGGVLFYILGKKGDRHE